MEKGRLNSKERETDVFQGGESTTNGAKMLSEVDLLLLERIYHFNNFVKAYNQLHDAREESEISAILAYFNNYTNRFFQKYA